MIKSISKNFKGKLQFIRSLKFNQINKLKIGF